MKIRKAIIPAAGLGTRFLPATKAQPKEMLPIVDKPTIQYIIEEAVQSGIEQILIVTGRNKWAIENHFDRSIELELELEKGGKQEMLDMVRNISDMVDIHYIRQKQPLGLGHAIYCAHSFIGNEPFAVLLGDDVIYAQQRPVLRQMMDVFEQYETSIVGVQQVPWEDTDKYGIVDGCAKGDRLYQVRDLVEKPKADPPSNVAILGRYIITPDIFDILRNTQKGSGGEIQLTDGLRTLAKDQTILAYEFEGLRYDVGSKIGFLKANVEYALRNEELRGAFSAYLQELMKHE